MSSRNCTLIVAAEAREFRGILQSCGNAIRLDWPLDFATTVTWNGRRLVLIANGPGFRLVSRAMEIAGAKERFDAVVSTGFCGGLDPLLRVGDVVEASSVLDVASGRQYPCRPMGAEVRYPLASQDRVAGTSAEKSTLRQATGAGAVEMEAAAVARFAIDRAASFYCVRAVSDTASHSFPIPLNDLRDAEGRFHKTRIVWEALKRPWSRIPSLLQLNRNCVLAETRLGEFFANCNLA
jgi:adenosylhomocysteine nucleosidase